MSILLKDSNYEICIQEFYFLDSLYAAPTQIGLFGIEQRQRELQAIRHLD